MKALGLGLMMPFILQICGVIVVLFVSSQLKKKRINPEDFKGQGLYDKGFSFAQLLNSLSFLFIILFVIGLLLYCGWIF